MIFFLLLMAVVELTQNLQVLTCSFNNTGPGSNHLFSLESKNYSFITWSESTISNFQNTISGGAVFNYFFHVEAGKPVSSN